MLDIVGPEFSQISGQRRCDALLRMYSSHCEEITGAHNTRRYAPNCTHREDRAVLESQCAGRMTDEDQRKEKRHRPAALSLWRWLRLARTLGHTLKFCSSSGPGHTTHGFVLQVVTGKCFFFSNVRPRCKNCGRVQLGWRVCCSWWTCPVGCNLESDDLALAKKFRQGALFRPSPSRQSEGVAGVVPFTRSTVLWLLPDTVADVLMITSSRRPFHRADPLWVPESS